MIGYVTIGANDFDAAAKFYDGLAAAMGGKRVMEFSPTFYMYGNGDKGGMIALTKPYNKEAATVSNGGMLALTAKDKAQVDAVHAAALALGGTCDGPPGARMDTFYAAYFRDLEGNKLCAYHMG